MCLNGQGHNAVKSVRLEPAAPRSRVKHSTTALPQGHCVCIKSIPWILKEYAGDNFNNTMQGITGLLCREMHFDRWTD